MIPHKIMWSCKKHIREKIWLIFIE